MKIGVLALQGGFAEHCDALLACGAEPLEIRTTADLTGLRGIILPGGESTTIASLLRSGGLAREIAGLIQAGIPVFGTCAGMILLARRIAGSDQFSFGALDVTVKRNSYGRQQESFEALLQIPSFGKRLFPGIFIRAPQITAHGKAVTVLARHNSFPVLVQQGNILCASFHPELTLDRRIHQSFINIAQAHHDTHGALS